MHSPALAHAGPSVGPICYWLARLYLWIFRWDTEGPDPDCPKAVFVAAPHTSNWDMPNMIACAWAYRMKPSWAGKRALFKWPWGWLMRWFGGVPVDRSGNRNTVQAIADLFASSEKLYLGVAPAGTRSYTDHWKSGFYHIAKTAGVPILCGYLDYGRRLGGLGLQFIPSGDIRADMDRIRAFYADMQGKRPALKSVIRLREEGSTDEAERGRT